MQVQWNAILSIKCLCSTLTVTGQADIRHRPVTGHNNRGKIFGVKLENFDQLSIYGVNGLTEVEGLAPVLDLLIRNDVGVKGIWS